MRCVVLLTEPPPFPGTSMRPPILPAASPLTMIRIICPVASKQTITQDKDDDAPATKGGGALNPPKESNEEEG